MKSARRQLPALPSTRSGSVAASADVQLYDKNPPARARAAAIHRDVAAHTASVDDLSGDERPSLMEIYRETKRIRDSHAG